MSRTLGPQAEAAVAGEIAAYQAAKAAEANLRAAEAAVSVALANYEAGASAGELGTEAGLRQALVVGQKCPGGCEGGPEHR